MQIGARFSPTSFFSANCTCPEYIMDSRALRIKPSGFGVFNPDREASRTVVGYAPFFPWIFMFPKLVFHPVVSLWRA